MQEELVRLILPGGAGQYCGVEGLGEAHARPAVSGVCHAVRGSREPYLFAPRVTGQRTYTQ